MLKERVSDTATGRQVVFTVLDSSCEHELYIFDKLNIRFNPVSKELRNLLDVHCPSDCTLDLLQLRGCQMQASYRRSDAKGNSTTISQNATVP